MAIVIFSHGKESGPNGTKIKLLSQVAKKLNFETKSIDYTKCADVDERVELLKGILDGEQSEKVILVGSSMGGYVSTVLASEIKVDGLFLMCPALYLPSYPIQNYTPKTQNIEIVHGWNDRVVPYGNSIQFGKLNSAKLHLVDDNHRLSNSLQILQDLFALFLAR